MTIEDLKVILNQAFICSEKYLQEFDSPKKGKQKTPYKRIQIRGKQIKTFLLFRIEDKDLTFFYEPSNTEKAKSGLRLMCDYFLCFEFKETFYVLFIELKGHKTSHAKKQIEAAYCLFEYIKETAKRIEIDVGKIEYRKVIVKEGSCYRDGTSYTAYSRDGDYYIAPHKNTNDFLLIDDFISPN